MLNSTLVLKTLVRFFLERKYILYSNTSWGLSRLNTTNKILMLKVPSNGLADRVGTTRPLCESRRWRCGPAVFVVLRSLTFLGNEARPVVLFGYYLPSKKPKQFVLLIIFQISLNTRCVLY